jgi:hypothetical protein
MSLATQTHECSTAITTARNSIGSFAEAASSLLAQNRHNTLIDGVVSAIAGFDNNQFLLRQLAKLVR